MTEPAQDQNVQVTLIDGREALAFIIIRPAENRLGLVLEAAAEGIDKGRAAYILRHVAHSWDPDGTLAEGMEQELAELRAKDNHWDQIRAQIVEAVRAGSRDRGQDWTGDVEVIMHPHDGKIDFMLYQKGTWITEPGDPLEEQGFHKSIKLRERLHAAAADAARSIRHVRQLGVKLSTQAVELLAAFEAVEAHELGHGREWAAPDPAEMTGERLGEEMAEMTEYVRTLNGRINQAIARLDEISPSFGGAPATPLVRDLYRILDPDGAIAKRDAVEGTPEHPEARRAHDKFKAQLIDALDTIDATSAARIAERPQADLAGWYSRGARGAVRTLRSVFGLPHTTDVDAHEASVLREAARLAEDLTRSYLHPALQELGVTNPEQYSLHWNTEEGQEAGS